MQATGHVAREARSRIDQRNAADDGTDAAEGKGRLRASRGNRPNEAEHDSAGAAGRGLLGSQGTLRERIALGNFAAIAAGSLGSVEGDVCFAEKMLEGAGFPILAGEHAEAHGNGNKSAGGLHRVLRNGFANLLRSGESKGSIAAVKNNQEFFSAVAADKIVGAH